MSRVLFRPHRGGLDQAMKECKVFSSFVDMLNYVCDQYNKLFNTDARIYDFSFEFYSYDKRIDWETICILDPEGHVLGWCAFNDDAKDKWEVKL